MAVLRFLVLLSLAFFAAVNAFSAVTPRSVRSVTALHASQKTDAGRQAAVSLVAAAYLMANVAATTPAWAAFDDHSLAESTQLLAARSGGRAGGRASPSYRAPTVTRSTTIVQPTTTYVTPAPTVVVTPSYGYGFGYSPFSGFGLGFGLGALDSAGDAIRDYRQESEIQRSKAELEVAKQREAEMEARIRQLELAQQSK